MDRRLERIRDGAAKTQPVSFALQHFLRLRKENERGFVHKPGSLGERAAGDLVWSLIHFERKNWSLHQERLLRGQTGTSGLVTVLTQDVLKKSSQRPSSFLGQFGR